MAGEFRLTYAPHPLKLERHVVPVPEGLTVQQIVDLVVPDRALRDHAVAFMRGTVIPADKWPHVRPLAGSHLELRVAPRGGGGGKDFAGIILTVAVLALAFAAPELLIAGGLLTETALAGSVIGSLTVGGLITAGVGLVGMLLVNALVPVKPPKLNDLSGSGAVGATSPALFIQGARNAGRPFSPVPVVLGRHRRYPEYGTRPYTEVIGEEHYVRMLFVWGVGPLAIDVDSLKIGETPLSEFDGVQVEHDEGYPGTPVALTLYPDTVVQDDSSILLTSTILGGDWVTRTSEQEVDELSIDLTFPQGLVGFPNDQAAVNASGPGPYTLTVKVEIEFREAGTTDWSTPSFAAKTVPDAWVSGNEVTFTHNKQAAIRHGFRWSVPSRGQYEVRVRKTFEAGTNVNGPVPTYRTELYWTALRSILDEDPVQSPVPVAKTALVIKATDQLNRTIDEFNGVVTSVGQDYSATTPVGWVDDQEVQNPAALFRLVLQGNGVAEAVPDERIDLEALEDWHDFCEARGFKFNMVRDFRASVWDTLADVCQAGRAAPTQVDGKWSVVIDREQAAPVSHVTPRNSYGFSVEKLFLDLPHAWRVRFPNEDEGWRLDERSIYADGFDAATATKFETLELPGVTDPDQVHQLARWRLLQGVHQPERWTFSQDLEFLTYQRGDRLLVTHDVLLVGLRSGRVKAVDVDTNDLITRVHLDEEVVFEDGASYGLSVRHLGAVATTTQVDNPANGGTADVAQQYVDPVTPLAAGSVSVGDLFGFGYVGSETDDALVISIAPDAEFRAQVVAVPYREAIYAPDDETPPVFETNLTPLPAIPTPNITGAVSDETVLRIGPGNAALARLAVDFDPNDYAFLDDPRIDVQYRLTEAGEPFYDAVVDSVSPGRVLLGGVQQGQTWDVRLRFRVAGRVQPGPWAYLFNHTVVGRASAPAGLANLTLSAFGGQALLRWDRPLDVDVVFGGEVRWRHSPATDGSATWADSTSIGNASRSTDLVASLPLKPGTYLGRVYDSAGNPSDDVASVITKQVALWAFGTALSIDEAPTFAGTHDDTEEVDNGLSLAATGLFDDITDFDEVANVDAFGGIVAEGTYLFANDIDLGTVDAVRLTTRVTVAAATVGDTIDSRINSIDTWEDFDGETQALVDCVVYVRHTDDDPAVSGATWSSWERLESAEFIARAFQFKAVLTSADPDFDISVTELGVDAERP